MIVREGQYDGLTTTIIEHTPIGSFCIVPKSMDSSDKLSPIETRLVKRKARLLSNLLLNEDFLRDVRSLYANEPDCPPFFVGFGRLHPEDSGSRGYLGNTSSELTEIDGRRFALLELNFLDRRERQGDQARILDLWAGLCQLLLCHSKNRPTDRSAVVNWAQAHAKRAWLLAVRKGHVVPQRKSAFALERMYYINAKPTRADTSSARLLTIPFHFRSASTYKARFQRLTEDLSIEAEWHEKSDYIRQPPWRWNDTSGFAEVLLSREGDLIADFFVATTSTQILRHQSVELATANASSRKIFRFFNNLTWPSATYSTTHPLEAFLGLVHVYVDCVLGWNSSAEDFVPAARAMDLTKVAKEAFG